MTHISSVRAFAISLVLVAVLPAVGCTGQTTTASNVRSNSARLNAKGTANNGPAYAYFEYWETANPGAKLTTQTVHFPANASGPFGIAVDDLWPSRSYSYRVCGNDEGSGAACAQTVSFSTVPPSGSGKYIAFVSKGDIWRMASDGTGRIRLTTDPGSDDWPAWSPDGSKIMFTSYRGGAPDLYVMNADGSNQTRITNNPAQDIEAQWAPDGRRIAFVSDRDDRAGDLYLMDPDGSNVTRLTSGSSGDLEESWSPDSRQLVFQGWRASPPQLFLLRVDTGVVAPLTNIDGGTEYPAWSPDGNAIAFDATGDGHTQVWVMPSAGGAPTQLTHGNGVDGSPSWSPDGKRIAFTSNRLSTSISDINNGIYVMNRDGTNQTRISPVSAKDDYEPVWSP